MRVLGIETTCDETAVAVVSSRIGGDGGDILSNEVMSQIAQHAAYGGVVPEIAARAHIDVLERLIVRALDTAGTDLSGVDAIAASAGPGLIGGILVGLTAAKALALAADKPFIAVNHLEAHALTGRLTERLDFPYLALLISGGHTQLVAVLGVGDYRRLGSTVDDAAGEAFDKVAKMLGLPYPGGPHIERLAEEGDPGRFDFPRPMFGREGADFSLSGLKTAVRQEIARLEVARQDGASQETARSGPTERDVADLAASFQAAIVDVLVDRTRSGLRIFTQSGGRPNGLVIGGGVGANGAIRRALTRLCAETGLRFVSPPPGLCSDNGAIVAWAGLERFARGMTDDLTFAARPRWPLDANAGPLHHGKA
ncbi:MAG TPA: tRNA (adenosine(37)-N6)-threonylcarbamoyltransferase complex transferase subunit TsaD [Methylosinus sp.]|jgi:N6-L-threonylcarbamoyladenine synthase|uniref:tRNA (adenosine(37)-N6)-threonylcarbamoyltransferase complex transferase subunit TsaD n=1 Tax=Methylosinus sp. TaxID=427 RepID=UPI002F935625